MSQVGILRYLLAHGSTGSSVLAEKVVGVEAGTRAALWALKGKGIIETAAGKWHISDRKRAEEMVGPIPLSRGRGYDEPKATQSPPKTAQLRPKARATDNAGAAPQAPDVPQFTTLTQADIDAQDVEAAAAEGAAAIAKETLERQEAEQAAEEGAKAIAHESSLEAEVERWLVPNYTGPNMAGPSDAEPSIDETEALEPETIAATIEPACDLVDTGRLSAAEYVARILEGGPGGQLELVAEPDTGPRVLVYAVEEGGAVLVRRKDGGGETVRIGPEDARALRMLLSAIENLPAFINCGRIEAAV